MKRLTVLLAMLASTAQVNAQPVRFVAGPGLLHGGEHNHALTNAELNNPKVKFIVPRERWSYLEPKDDRYDTSYLLKQIQRARAINKPYVLGVMTGGCAPLWLPGVRYKGLVVPWSDTIAVEYRELHQHLANLEVAPGLKLKDDPLFCMVWINGPTVSSQEAHTKAKYNGVVVDFSQAPGFTAAKMLTAWKASIDTIAELYPGVACVYSVSGQPPVQAYQPAVIAYARQKLGPRATFQHNSLGTQTNITATHHRILTDLAKQGVRVGSEAVQPGHVSAITKFPQATYTVWYPGDERGLK